MHGGAMHGGARRRTTASVVSQGTPSLVIIGAFLAGATCAWFGRGYYDNAIVSTDTATKQTQEAVNSSTAKAQTITDAKRQSAGASKRASDSLALAHVDASCPPGVGAVSPALAGELRSAFAPASADTAKH